MGAYTWLTDDEFKLFTRIESDEDIDEALVEVRSVMPNWFIDERTETRKSFWGKKTTTTRYTVYHRQKEDYSEVRIQMSAVNKAQVLNLLYGLYMGYHTALSMKQHGK